MRKPAALIATVQILEASVADGGGRLNLSGNLSTQRFNCCPRVHLSDVRFPLAFQQLWYHYCHDEWLRHRPAPSANLKSNENEGHEYGCRSPDLTHEREAFECHA